MALRKHQRQQGLQALGPRVLVVHLAQQQMGSLQQAWVVGQHLLGSRDSNQAGKAGVSKAESPALVGKCRLETHPVVLEEQQARRREKGHLAWALRASVAARHLRNACMPHRDTP